LQEMWCSRWGGVDLLGLGALLGVVYVHFKFSSH
jgi:hypothetical protein